VTEEQVFLAALDLPDATARASYLDATCGVDSAFRKQVDALLANHFRSGEFLDIPAAAQIKAGARDDETLAAASDALPAATNPDDESEGLYFLTPSDRPDSLGRLGRYEVLQVLGKGGFGIVFRAYDDVLQRIVAIKVMAPQLAVTSPARKRFLREARTSAQVRHENVVHVYEVGEQPLPFLVMEFIPGETLQERLDRVGPLDVSETLRIGRQIAEGLAAAHANDLIHRDIKPGNVLLEGGHQKVKITDFGLARAADDASMTQSGMIAGTPMYMAPEQALGQTLDQRADLFSLGSVLYQMVAGRPPFRANTTVAVLKRVAEDAPRSIREVIPETPQWLCAIITKLHAKKPADRYQSAREVADVLADCEDQLKANSKLKDFSRIPRAQPQRSTWRKWVTAATAVLLSVLVLAVLASPFLYKYANNRCALIFSGTIDPNLDNILIKRDGHVVAELITSHGIVHLPAGDYEAEVLGREGFELARYRVGPYSVLGGVPGALGWQEAAGGTFPLTLSRDFDVGIYVELAKSLVASSNSPQEEPGWTPIFNGKDLTGWKFHPDHLGSWEVKDGILRGSTRQSHLFSERGDYGNFHLRAEVKVNLGGDSGILFRAPFELRRGRTPTEFGVPGCYEAELQHNRLHLRPTGSVSHASGDAPPSILDRVSDNSLTRPDEWFTYEVIAENNHFITKINGVEAAICDDPLDRHKAGHIVLQVWHPNTLVQFRKIGIKELPPKKSGWTQLFNGKDLAGWELGRQIDEAKWEVKDDALVGRGPVSHLYSRRGDFSNFHLRAEVMMGASSNAGIWFRVPRGPGRPFEGYEAQLGDILAKPKTGSLIRLTGRNSAIWHSNMSSQISPETWFTYEIIATGPTLQLKVNSEETARLVDTDHRAGHVVLEVFGDGDVVQFRKIEISELPETPPTPDAIQQPLPTTYTNSLGMEFVMVSKGKSWLGGGKDKPGEQEVEIPADFYLGKYEVTQDEWEQVMGENFSHFSRDGGGLGAVQNVSDAELKRFPVENVTWEQCQEFVNKLNKLEKQRQSGWVYRLPTEEEWEYACRGGSMASQADSAFDYYFATPTNTLLPEQANFKPHGLGRTRQVGSFEPNVLGLYDMHGNVEEWCGELTYLIDIPRGAAIRGGCFDDDGAAVAASVPFVRYGGQPSEARNNLGCRLARVPFDAAPPEATAPPDPDVKEEQLPPTVTNGP
jgi:serine/threonine protein kinase/formylglycine-generating enzyme required for sulfatase activity